MDGVGLVHVLLSGLIAYGDLKKKKKGRRDEGADLTLMWKIDEIFSRSCISCDVLDTK